MKNIVYKSTKITIGVILAIVIAELFGLMFATTAGVIAMLSILDTRKQTYIVGLKRIGASFVAILLAVLLFTSVGHNLIALTVFLLLMIPLLVFTKSAESLAVSTVLVSHIYTIADISFAILLNEVGLVLIGVLVAMVLNVHVINIEGDIRESQMKAEELIRKILDKMQYQLMNQCELSEQKRLLAELDETLTLGMNQAIAHTNNYFVKDTSYYIRYFQMRRQQYLLLTNMQKYFEVVFVSMEQVRPLSDFTGKLALELNESHLGETLLDEANGILSYYRNQELPKTREEFENRAVLFLYLNDLIRFKEIKIRFLQRFGNIRYYGEMEK